MGRTFLVPLTERERIPGTWALPPFPRVRTKPGAPCQEAGAELRHPGSGSPQPSLLSPCCPGEGSGHGFKAQHLPKTFLKETGHRLKGN